MTIRRDVRHNPQSQIISSLKAEEELGEHTYDFEARREATVSIRASGELVKRVCGRSLQGNPGALEAAKIASSLTIQSRLARQDNALTNPHHSETPTANDIYPLISARQTPGTTANSRYSANPSSRLIICQ